MSDEEMEVLHAQFEKLNIQLWDTLIESTNGIHEEEFTAKQRAAFESAVNALERFEEELHTLIVACASGK